VSFDLDILLRLFVSILLGGAVGVERQAHGRAAGLRTHILVCLGSTLAMIVTQSFGLSVDPGRALAGILTGIGFLGAGVIVKSNEIVRGLTTAACVWFVAALGVAVGQGLYLIAGISTVLVLVVLTLLSWFSHKVPTVSYHTAVVRAQTLDAGALDARCRDFFRSEGFRIIAVSSRIGREPTLTELTFRLRIRKAPDIVRLTGPLLALPHVVQADWD
jgi:putative Mg2+ transporter-C (MgtC) family protein